MNAGNQKKNQGQEASGNLLEKGREAASNVAQAASNAAQSAGNMASNLGERAEGAAASVGSGMQSLGEKVREKGPESGFLGRATESVAGALESGGKYLEEKRFSGIGEDLTNLIRRNPIPALLVGVGLGFLLARTMRG